LKHLTASLTTNEVAYNTKVIYKSNKKSSLVKLVTFTKTLHLFNNPNQHLNDEAFVKMRTKYN